MLFFRASFHVQNFFFFFFFFFSSLLPELHKSSSPLKATIMVFEELLEDTKYCLDEASLVQLKYYKYSVRIARLPAVPAH